MTDSNSGAGNVLNVLGASYARDQRIYQNDIGLTSRGNHWPKSG